MLKIFNWFYAYYKILNCSVTYVPYESLLCLLPTTLSA
jgi:hypothetical protein